MANENQVERPFHILQLSARDASALLELYHRYEKALTKASFALPDVCFTAAQGRSHFEERLAIVCRTRDEAVKKLKATSAGERPWGVIRGRAGESLKIGFLFTGQGSQYIGMGRELYETQPLFRQSLDRCAEILRGHMKTDLLEVLFKDTSGLIDQTEYTQPSLFSLEYSLYELWRSFGVEPRAVMGHSVGEYIAACVAGVFSLEDGLKLIAARGRLMQNLPGEGTMGAIGAREERVRAALKGLEDRVSLAAINGPESTVIAGDSQIVRQVLERFEAQKVKVKQLTVSHGFHSPQMDPMLNEFEQIAATIQFNTPKIPLISNLLGKRVEAEVCQPNYWRRHAREAVRFLDGVQALYEEGCRAFVEVGPGTTLLGMARSCLQEAVSEGALWAPSLKPGRSDWEQLAESVASLHVRGTKIDWQAWDQPYSSRRKVRLPTYAFQRKKYWVEGGRIAMASLNSPDSNFEVASGDASARPEAAENTIIARLKKASPAEYGNMITDFIVAAVKDSMGFDDDIKIDSSRELAEFGIDSLSSIALRNAIKSGFKNNIEISMTILFEYPTIADLAQRLEELVRGAFGKETSAPKTVQAKEKKSWIRCRTPRPGARLRLFCFHYAGGAAQIFDPWAALLPDSIELCAVQLPGRWERIAEPSLTSMTALVDGIYDGLKDRLDKPFATLGYSFGGTLCYLWTRMLIERKQPLPEHFFPMASPAPQNLAQLGFAKQSVDLNDQELLAAFQKSVAGIPAELVANADLQKIFLPILRSDVLAMESYTYQPAKPMDVPITAFAGRADHWAAAKMVEGWSSHAVDSFHLRLIEGDHFFLHSQEGHDLPGEIAAILDGHSKLRLPRIA